MLHNHCKGFQKIFVDDKIVSHVTVMRVPGVNIAGGIEHPHHQVPGLGHAAVTCDVSRIVTGHVHFRKLHHVGCQV